MVLWIVRRIVRGWRWAKDQYIRLSGRQRAVILVSVTFPMVLHLLSVGFSPDCVTIAYALAGFIAAPLLSSTMNYERATTEHLVDQNVYHLSDQVSQLREDHEHAKVELRREVVDLEGFIRTSLAECGIVLPPRPVMHRVDATGASSGIAVPEPTVTVCRNRSWKARLRGWMRSVWKFVYGTPEAS